MKNSCSLSCIVVESGKTNWSYSVTVGSCVSVVRNNSDWTTVRGSELMYSGSVTVDILESDEVSNSNSVASRDCESDDVNGVDGSVGGNKASCPGGSEEEEEEVRVCLGKKVPADLSAVIIFEGHVVTGSVVFSTIEVCSKGFEVVG